MSLAFNEGGRWFCFYLSFKFVYVYIHFFRGWIDIHKGKITWEFKRVEPWNGNDA